MQLEGPFEGQNVVTRPVWPLIVKTSREKVKPYVTKDGSEVRELMHPRLHGNLNQSLAEAVIPPHSATHLHKHRISEEIYHIRQGRGMMTLGAERFPVKAGDTVSIPSGVFHAVRNTGDGLLRILCCCTPPYKHDDTELMTDL